MVIEYDRVHAARFQRRDFVHRRRAAVERDEKLRVVLRDAARDAVRAEAVSLVHAMRQERARLRAECAQHAREQRERRDAVHIVIAVKHDALAGVDCGEDARDGAIHVWQEKRIAERFQFREKKVPCVRAPDAALRED